MDSAGIRVIRRRWGRPCRTRRAGARRDCSGHPPMVRYPIFARLGPASGELIPAFRSAAVLMSGDATW